MAAAAAVVAADSGAGKGKDAALSGVFSLVESVRGSGRGGPLSLLPLLFILFDVLFLSAFFNLCKCRFN